MTTTRPEMVEGKADSAIRNHVKLSPDCLRNVCSNVVSHFSVEARARSKSHDNVLGAIFIARLRPELCSQKDLLEVCVCFEV